MSPIQYTSGRICTDGILCFLVDGHCDPRRGRPAHELDELERVHIQRVGEPPAYAFRIDQVDGGPMIEWKDGRLGEEIDDFLGLQKERK